MNKRLLYQIEENTHTMDRIAEEMHQEAIQIHESIRQQAQQQAEFDRMLQEHLAASRAALGM